MAGTFTVMRDGVETTRSAGYDAELHAVTRGYSNSYSFGYCKDISAYCEIDDCTDILLDHWGFTVWRTVFTPSSDAAFARTLDIINQWVKYECFEEAERTYDNDGKESLDHAAASEVWKRYRNIIIDDQDLDGASPATVRQKFLAWIESHGVKQNTTSRYRFCIVIDEQVLETFSRFHTPAMGEPEEESQVYSVKVIDVEIDGENDGMYPRDYKCCVMTPPWMLARLYFFFHNSAEDEIRGGHDIPTFVIDD